MAELPNATATTRTTILCNIGFLMAAIFPFPDDSTAYAVCVGGIERCPEAGIFTALKKRLLDLAIRLLRLAR
jgi:hypothetical protein